MAISNFEFPKVTLEQHYAAGTATAAPTLGVACVGPRYILHRADKENEAAKITAAYNPSTGLTADLPGHVNGATPDIVNAKTQRLVIKNGVFSYATADKTAKYITINNVKYIYAGETDSSTYAWAAGSDTVYTQSASPTASGTAYADEACEGETTYTIATVGTDTNFAVSGSVITFTDLIVKSGNGYTATDAIFGVRGLLVGDPIIINDGTHNIIATVLAIGTSVANGPYNKITLGSGYAGALTGATSLVFCEKQDVTYTQSSTTFSIAEATPGNYTLTILGGLTTKLNDLYDREGELQSGDMYIEYRERVNAGVGSLGSLASLGDIEAVLGGACADNPLALACYFAMAGGSNTMVYYTVVAEDTADAYIKALDYLAQFNEVYSIVPSTTDEGIIQACVASCTSYSNDMNSKIRRACWYGVDTSSELLLWSGDATFTAGTTSTDIVITLAEDVFIDHPMHAGDIFKWNGGTGTEWVIQTTNGLNIAYATKAADDAVPSGALTVNYIRRAPENSELVEDIIAKRSARSTSERAVCVWADDVEFNGEIISNYAVAAAAAGMRAYEPCQRPISNLGYSFFSLANTHGFALSDLTRLGANGVWIIGDNTNGLPVNKRQMTTAVANNLLLDEESIIANADTLAINLSRMGENYVGNSNITPVLLAQLEVDLNTYLSSCTINNTGNILIGPQLLDYTIVAVWQDTVNLDHIYADIEVQPPRPFNRFHITMRVI